MAKDLIEEKEEDQPYTKFERFLFFATPIIFLIVLLIVLLFVFSSNWRGQMLDIVEKVPIVNKWLPDQGKKPSTDEGKKEAEPDLNKEVEDLKALLASKDNDLRVLADKRTELEQKVKELSTKVEQAEKRQESDRATSEEYEKQVKELANMYASMMPSKAAPIMENLTMDELVLVFNAMKNDDRVKILEKMNPKIAAEASIRLKDVKPTESQAIAALQSRLTKMETDKKPSTGLDKAQINRTFASMTPKSGADILLETAKISQDKVLAVLNAVDDSTRSKLIDAMTQIDNAATAKIVAKLFP